MVQITFDTNTDSIEELEHAQRVIADAIARRNGTPHVHHKQATAPVPVVAPVEETTIDTPFLKISIRDDEPTPAQSETAAPTLNQLLEEASLSEEEMSKMFKQVQDAEPPVHKMERAPSDEASFIEIVEFDEEEKEK